MEPALAWNGGEGKRSPLDLRRSRSAATRRALLHYESERELPSAVQALGLRLSNPPTRTQTQAIADKPDELNGIGSVQGLNKR